MAGGKNLLQIRFTQDYMAAYIPAKTPIAKELAELDFDGFVQYLVKQGVATKPTENAFAYLKSLATSNAPFTLRDMVIAKGTEFKPGKPAAIEWLNPKNTPRDLVFPGVPVIRVTQPTPTIHAQTVQGKILPPVDPKAAVEYPPIAIPPELKLNEKGEYVCTSGGQLTVSDTAIIFTPIYNVKRTSEKTLEKIEFPCDVHVKGDLEGAMQWKIKGNLTVEGHWSAPHIEVDGDVVAMSGLQTNFPQDESKAIKIKGNLKANFIQVSRIIVGKNISIEKALLNSYITVAGDLECLGSPGIIMGTDIYITGSIRANKVGSEKGTPTAIRFIKPESAESSRIDLICTGTKLYVLKKLTIIQFDTTWPMK